jgi:hypothetical protein
MALPVLPLASHCIVSRHQQAGCTSWAQWWLFVWGIASVASLLEVQLYPDLAAGSVPAPCMSQ